MTLASLLSPLVAATDTELQHHLVSDLQPLLSLLDEFFMRGTSLQTSAVDSNDDVESQGLSSSSRAVFALFLRLGHAPHLLQLAVDCGLLHVTRLVSFCQLYGDENPEAISELLNAIYDNVAAFPATLQRLEHFYIQQLSSLHVAVQQAKCNDATNQVRYCYELILSLCGMTAARSVTHLLLLGHKELERAVLTPSVLSGLVQCYESVLPALQRQISTFDQKLVPHETLVIAETRRTMLLVLERCVDAVMHKLQATGTSGEELLAGLYALSHGCEGEDAEQGSYLSDWWYLCGYKNQVTAFFEQCKLDDENLSYLEMVMDQLPRRQIVPKLLVHDAVADNEVNAMASVDTQHVPSLHDAPKPFIDENTTELVSMVQQVQDLFPELGDGYIELCLLSSNRHVEEVINFLLESNPPPALLDVPHDLNHSDADFVRLRAQIEGNVEAFQTTEAKLDPKRVWVGKKPRETTYDPQIITKDAQWVGKMKQLVAMYEEEDELWLSREERVDSRSEGGMLDEYDDEYDDELDDVVPFNVHDCGSLDDQDAIREQNRRMRAKEEKEAFWEGMKNRNRDKVVQTEEGDKDDWVSETVVHTVAANPCSQHASRTKHLSVHAHDRKQGKTSDQPLTVQQIQRQRARKDKNKAKVANHNRKDRALKKMG